MRLPVILNLLQQAGQPVTPLLDGHPCPDLDVGRFVAAGDKRQAQLRMELADGDRVAVVQGTHESSVEVRNSQLAQPTFSLTGADTVQHVWVLSELVPVSVAQALCNLVQGRLVGAGVPAMPTSLLRVPETVEHSGWRPVRVFATGSGECIDPSDVLIDTVGRDAAADLLREVAA